LIRYGFGMKRIKLLSSASRTQALLSSSLRLMI
jgi:hypothetical protein